MNWDMFLFWGIIIFFALVTLIGGSIIWVLWRRRKLIRTNFLTETGQWEGVWWKPDDIGKDFVYDNETYHYNIKKATRDKINRPVAHYYKGNPEQLIFRFEELNKSIRIGNNDLTAKDFRVLMLSKVLRDIFQDDEVMNMLMIIIIEVAILSIIIIILILTRHTPAVTLAPNNQTINVIAEGVKKAIGQNIQ